jgi:hypothetical protein
MRILLLTAFLALPASATALPLAQPAPDPAQNCPKIAAQLAADRIKNGTGRILHKLTELPPADMYSAVYRRIGECEVPIIVKYRVGGQ